MKPECPHYISKLHDDFYCDKCEKQITMSKEDSKPDIKRYFISIGETVEMVEDPIGAYCDHDDVETLQKELSELRKENERLDQAEIKWFERTSDLESQLNKAKERIELLELMLENKNHKSNQPPF